MTKADGDVTLKKKRLARTQPFGLECLQINPATFKAVPRGWQGVNGTVHLHVGRPNTALCHLRQEGFFVAESSSNTAREPSATGGRQVLDREQMRRALIRIAHEILEGNVREPDIVIVGIHSGGVHLAERTADLIAEFEGTKPPVGQLDIGLYRDDLRRRGRPVMRPTPTQRCS